MSMISEQVADLREKAQIFENSGCATDGIVKTFRKAADTIEKLSAKLAINSHPPADQWIPCSERLPDKDGEYLVWYECGEDEDDEKGIAIVPFWTDIEMFGVYQDIFDSQSLGFVDSEFYECETAKAWMPLPEPFKGEQND